MMRYIRLLQNTNNVNKTIYEANRSKIKNIQKPIERLSYNDNNDYYTIKAIIHSSGGALGFNEKSNKFYFK
jgi:hypothetical protein